MKWVLQILIAINFVTFTYYVLYKETIAHNADVVSAYTSSSVKTLRLINERVPMMDVSSYGRKQISPSLCHTLGPYKDHKAAKNALNEISHFGKEASIRAERVRESVGYWVYLRAASEKESKTHIETLMNKGIDDYYRTGRNQISLGIYNGIQGAKKREASMSALGLSPLVEPYYREQEVFWIDVVEIERNMFEEREWAAYLNTYPEGERNSVECELINA